MILRALFVLAVPAALLAGCNRSSSSGGGDPDLATFLLNRVSVAPAKNWAAWSTLDHDCFSVYLRTRRVFHTRRLLWILGGAHPFPVDFRFHPDLEYDGPYGQRWRTSLDGRLMPQPGGDVVYRDAAGVEHTFTADGGGGFVSPTGCCALLEAVAAGFRLTHADRWVKIFDDTGLWTGLERPDGQLVELTREADHRITRIDTPEGRTYTFAYAKHLRLLSITDFAGRVYGFSYDRAGRLTAIERPQRAGDAAPPAFGYAYDGADFLRTVTNSAGQPYGVVSYDGEGRVTTIATPNGTATYAGDASSVQATARDGTAWQFDLNPDGQIVRIVNPAGGETAFDYDAFGRRMGVTEPSGKSVTFTYAPADGDPREFCNRIGSRTEPADFPATPALVAAYEFRPGTDQWVTQTKADGTRIDWEYDDRGLMTAMTLPEIRTTAGLERGVWQFRYDALGLLIERETPTGAVTTLSYGDGVGAPADLVVREVRDAGPGDDPKTGLPRRNETVTYAYDAAGNRSRVTFPDGTVQDLLYDAWDNVTSITDEAGTTSLYTYDAAGRLVRTERPHADHEGDPIGSGVVFREFDFDVFDLPLELRAHDAFTTRTTTYEYGNGAYRPSRVVEPGGRTTDFAYDFAGRRTTRTVAPGTADASTTMWTFADGKLMTVTDPLGNETAFEYDGFGRRVSRTDATGTVRLFEYDACGRRTATTVRAAGGADLERVRTEFDGAGNIAVLEMDRITPDETERIERFYDLRGFLAEERLPGGAVRTICADGLGQVVREEEQPLDHATEYVWDARRRLVEKRAIRAGAATSTTFTYDALGNLVRTTDPLGRATEFAHDSGGNPSRVTTPDGKVATYVWDGRGELRSGEHTDGDVSLVETYGYDAAGRLASETRNGLTRSYTYDAHGRLRSTSAGGQELRSYDYDAAGRLVRATDPAGGIDYTYDAAGRLVAKVAGNQRQTFEYDGLGRLVRGTDRAEDGSEVTVTRSYDGFGNLLTDAQGGMGVTKTYAGRKPATLQTPNMRYDYAYDAAGRVASVDRDGRRYVDYAWMPGARKVASRTHPDSGLRSEFSYDELGRTTRVNTTTPGGAADADFMATYNAGGLLATQARADGSLAETLDYDALGRLLEKTVTVAGADRTTTYRYRPDSDRLASIANTRDGSDEAIEYDALGRITRAGDSVLTYGPDLAATNLFDDRPAYQPALAGRAGPAPRVEYSLVHDRWGRVTEVRNKGDGSLVASYGYDVFNRPVVSRELEFDGDGVLVRRKVFDRCRLVYEFSAEGEAGFDLFYVPDPAGDGHLASGFDDSFFAENLWQVDAQGTPRQLVGADGGAVQERYDDFSGQGTPHFEFPGAGDHFRGAPSLQSLANSPGEASSYASGLVFSWAGPLDDPFLPRPLPYVPGDPPGLDGFPRVGPVMPPLPGPLAPPLPRPEENRRDCTEARDTLQAAVDKMQDICNDLQAKQREIDAATDRLKEANDRVNGALRSLQDALEDIKAFDAAVERIKFAQNVDTALSLLSGVGGLAKGGLKAAKQAKKIGSKVTNASSRVARSVTASRQLAAVNSTFVSDASLEVIKSGLKGLLKGGVEIDVSISGFILAYGQLFTGTDIEGTAAELKAAAYRAFVDLQLAQNERGRAEKQLAGLLDQKEDLLDAAAASIGCFEDALEATGPWAAEVADIAGNGTETRMCFSTYGGR